jgi:UDP-N-acetyl-D-galactosamine dehydrogenase
MAGWVADEVVKIMLRKGIPVLNARILVLGLTFKENCPDLRNTKVVDLISGLKAYHAHVDVYDPWIDIAEARHEYGLDCLATMPENGSYDAVVLAVSHREFVAMGEAALRALGREHSVLYDVQIVFTSFILKLT